MEAIQSIDREATRRRFRLLLRFGRKISRDTGTLLSPDDRALGKTFEDETVLTLYQVTGEKDLGWSGAPFWIPNVRLPEGLVFHRG
jgi:hypothetical protein